MHNKLNLHDVNASTWTQATLVGGDRTNVPHLLSLQRIDKPVTF